MRGSVTLLGRIRSHRRTIHMPSTNASHEALRDTPKINRGARDDTEILSQQIESIRSEVQTLTAMVGDMATSQLSQAQSSAEDSIRRNPLAAVAIAAGLGFLYALVRR